MFYGMNAWFLASLTMGALWWVAGAALPAWRKLEPQAAAQAYLSSWSRGGPALAVLALLSSGLGFAAALDEPDLKWAIGAGFIAAALLFTLLFMAAPGHALRDHAARPDRAGPETYALLKRWGRLHLIRSALVSFGVFFFIWAAH